MIYQTYCTSSPLCDEDCCRCEQFAEEEEKQERLKTKEKMTDVGNNSDDIPF